MKTMDVMVGEAIVQRPVAIVYKRTASYGDHQERVLHERYIPELRPGEYIAARTSTGMPLVVNAANWG